jgi:hypothetical protein
MKKLIKKIKRWLESGGKLQAQVIIKAIWAMTLDPSTDERGRIVSTYRKTLQTKMGGNVYIVVRAPLLSMTLPVDGKECSLIEKTPNSSDYELALQDFMVCPELYLKRLELVEQLAKYRLSLSKLHRSSQQTYEQIERDYVRTSNGLGL